MSSWAARMHRRAATFSNVVTSCGHPSGPYPRRLEKVKFGVPLEEVCKNDIPGPLLVLILKLNKEAPYRKDVFRAPGNQGVMKKLIHFLQTGRLVNIDNFSVYTIASVLKKFLRKIPGGVFGRELENRFFEVIEMEDLQRQRDEIHRILTSLPVYTQRILVLLFGTFRVISSNSEKHNTGMTSEALGVSVAPSFFHSCVHDGRVAKMEDVMKFKIASKIVKHLIEEFATSDLFGRENYEFYARVTGRVLRVQGQWICSFQYPPVNVKDPVYPNEFIALEPYLIGHLSLGSDTWLRCDLELSQTDYSLEGNSNVEECQSTPALLEVTPPQVSSSSLGIITEHSLLESCTRLSISLEQNGLFQTGNNTSHSSSGSHSSRTSQNHSGPKMTLDELKEVNKYAESTKSLTYLPQVHERQTERMKTRSQWFLAPSVDCCSCGGSVDMLLEDIDVKTLTSALMRRSSSGTIDANTQYNIVESGSESNSDEAKSTILGEHGQDDQIDSEKAVHDVEVMQDKETIPSEGKQKVEDIDSSSKTKQDAGESSRGHKVEHTEIYREFMSFCRNIRLNSTSDEREVDSGAGIKQTTEIIRLGCDRNQETEVTPASRQPERSRCRYNCEHYMLDYKKEASGYSKLDNEKNCTIYSDFLRKQLQESSPDKRRDNCLAFREMHMKKITSREGSKDSFVHIEDDKTDFQHEYENGKNILKGKQEDCGREPKLLLDIQPGSSRSMDTIDHRTLGYKKELLKQSTNHKEEKCVTCSEYQRMNEKEIGAHKCEEGSKCNFLDCRSEIKEGINYRKRFFNYYEENLRKKEEKSPEKDNNAFKGEQENRVNSRKEGHKSSFNDEYDESRLKNESKKEKNIPRHHQEENLLSVENPEQENEHFDCAGLRGFKDKFLYFEYGCAEKSGKQLNNHENPSPKNASKRKARSETKTREEMLDCKKQPDSRMTSDCVPSEIVHSSDISDDEGTKELKKHYQHHETENFADKPRRVMNIYDPKKNESSRKGRELFHHEQSGSSRLSNILHNFRAKRNELGDEGTSSGSSTSKKELETEEGVLNSPRDRRKRSDRLSFTLKKNLKSSHEENRYRRL